MSKYDEAYAKYGREKTVLPSADDIEYYARRWGMVEYPDLVEDWAILCMNERGFCTGVQASVHSDQYRGSFFMCSTPQSTDQYLHNVKILNQGLAVSEVHWMHYHVYEHPGLALLNHSGWYNPGVGGVFRGFVWEFLDTLPHLVDWRVQYGTVSNGWLNDGMRRLFSDLGAPAWVEYSCGNSLAEYRSLDMYMRIVPARDFHATDSAWYLLNNEAITYERQEPKLYRWHEYDYARSYGQRDGCLDDFLVPDPQDRAVSYAKTPQFLWQCRNLFPDDWPSILRILRQQDPDVIQELVLDTHYVMRTSRHVPRPISSGDDSEPGMRARNRLLAITRHVV